MVSQQCNYSISRRERPQNSQLKRCSTAWCNSDWTLNTSVIAFNGQNGIMNLSSSHQIICFNLNLHNARWSSTPFFVIISFRYGRDLSIYKNLFVTELGEILPNFITLVEFLDQYQGENMLIFAILYHVT